MRSFAIISSSLLAIAVSGAPVDLPMLPVGLPNLGLPSLPTGLSAPPTRVPTEFSATLPSGLPTGIPFIPREPTNNAELPVKNLPIRRANLPVAEEALKGLKIPALASGDVLKDVTLIDGIDPKVHLALPINSGLTKKAVNVNTPVAVAVDDLVELPDVNLHQPTVAIPALRKVARDIKQSLPVLGGADVPLDAGNIQVGNVDKYIDGLVKDTKIESLPKIVRDIKQSLPVVGGADAPLDAGKIQVGTVDQYVDQLIKGTKIESLPKVTRDIGQSLPVVGGIDVPLDAGKIQVGTVDMYVDEVVKGTTLKNSPIEQVVKGTTVKDLPNLGSRDIKQSLPVVGGVDVPLDAGKIQVGTVDEYVEDVVMGTTIGL